MDGYVSFESVLGEDYANKMAAVAGDSPPTPSAQAAPIEPSAEAGDGSSSHDHSSAAQGPEDNVPSTPLADASKTKTTRKKTGDAATHKQKSGDAAKPKRKAKAKVTKPTETVAEHYQLEEFCWRTNGEAIKTPNPPVQRKAYQLVNAFQDEANVPAADRLNQLKRAHSNQLRTDPRLNTSELAKPDNVGATGMNKPSQEYIHVGYYSPQAIQLHSKDLIGRGASLGSAAPKLEHMNSNTELYPVVAKAVPAGLIRLRALVERAGPGPLYTGHAISLEDAFYFKEFRNGCPNKKKRKQEWGDLVKAAIERHVNGEDITAIGQRPARVPKLGLYDDFVPRISHDEHIINELCYTISEWQIGGGGYKRIEKILTDADPRLLDYSSSPQSDNAKVLRAFIENPFASLAASDNDAQDSILRELAGLGQTVLSIEDDRPKLGALQRQLQCIV